MLRYSYLSSIACKENNKSCFIIKIKSYFVRGCGLIMYKNYIDYSIVFKIKFFLYYLKILKKNKNFNFYLSIKPFIFKKFNNCIILAIFLSTILSFFNLKLKKNILIIGDVDIKNGKILNVDNLINKINKFRNLFKLIILSNEIKINNRSHSTLNFKNINEIYFFIKRCLAQRKSNVFTNRLSGVQFSQHLYGWNFKCF